jgi:methyltransferase family protein
MKKLDLGAGATQIEGFEPRDIKRGDSLMPLPDASGSVDEVRASHVLEHFSHREVAAVVAEWARVLKPGGLMRIAVPDLDYIARGYLARAPQNWQGYLMGGHAGADDVHKSAFDRPNLEGLMRAAGLIGIHNWQSEAQDCASLPVSLNLAGWKPPAVMPKVIASMSVPRLGFMDNFFCAVEMLAKLRIRLRKNTGAYWGQCLTRCIEELIAEGAEWILTLDYDSVYSAETVLDLVATAVANPHVDALVPLQMSRMRGKPLMTLMGPDGKAVHGADRGETDRTLLPIITGHFGCTLLRAEKFSALQRPWFHGKPDAEGRWGPDRVDDDIAFWYAWRAAGNSAFCAPRIVVGHAQLQIVWPDENLHTILQDPADYWKDGPPLEVWT